MEGDLAHRRGLLSILGYQPGCGCCGGADRLVAVTLSLAKQFKMK
jgi:hypothetical protein